MRGISTDDMRTMAALPLNAAAHALTTPHPGFHAVFTRENSSAA
jgi:hypothetical protein